MELFYRHLLVKLTKFIFSKMICAGKDFNFVFIQNFDSRVSSYYNNFKIDHYTRLQMALLK